VSAAGPASSSSSSSSTPSPVVAVSSAAAAASVGAKEHRRGGACPGRPYLIAVYSRSVGRAAGKRDDDARQTWACPSIGRRDPVKLRPLVARRRRRRRRLRSAVRVQSLRSRSRTVYTHCP